jgi:hypothetical protein
MSISTSYIKEDMIMHWHSPIWICPTFSADPQLLNFIEFCCHFWEETCLWMNTPPLRIRLMHFAQRLHRCNQCIYLRLMDPPPPTPGIHSFNLCDPYGLDDRGSRVWLPAGTGNFSLHHRFQNGSGAHPAYQIGTRGSFLGGKAAGAWSWPLTSTSCRGQREELYLHSPNTP